MYVIQIPLNTHMLSESTVPEWTLTSQNPSVRISQRRKFKEERTLLMPCGLYRTKHSNVSWGLPETIDLITTAMIQYHTFSPDAPLVNVGDLSLERGGKFPPHLSHRVGRDVDVGYVHRGDKKDQSRFTYATSNNFDVEKSWSLIKAFLETDSVEYIFMDYYLQKKMYRHALKSGEDRKHLKEIFQYPRGKYERHGVIRYSKGHRNHFHVRFKRAEQI